MADHIIDKFTFDGETYILQDNQSGYATEGYVDDAADAILENTVADVTVGGTSVVNAGNVAVVPAIPTKVSDLTNDSGFITSYTETDPTVPSWAKASTKPSYTASEVGAVPTSRTINGKALTDNISLTASDVGALPNTTTIPTVSVNRKTTSGTNIADITINGTTTQLYAPTSGGGGGEENVIETISVNNVEVEPDSNKNVDIAQPVWSYVSAQLENSAKTVCILYISGSTAAMINASGSAINMLSYALAYLSPLDAVCIQPTASFTGMQDIVGRVYEPCLVDMVNARVKLQCIENGILYTVDLQDSGSGLVGTYTETAIPSAVATATPTTNTISDVSSSSITTVQYGCVVSVDVDITLTAAVANQTQLCASLPKPLTAVRTVANQFETTYKRPLRFILGTSGMLDIRLGEAGRYYHHFTYITNEGITTLTDGDLTSF